MKDFDFNGANSFVGSDDKHHYGGNYRMYFDNEIIKQNKKLSFLICKKDLVDFYKKINWKLIKNNNISIPDHSFSTNGMIFNYNNTQVEGGVKYIFYINK